MTFIYPAVFTPRPQGGYIGFFPDLEGIEVEGISLDRAIEEAQEAMLAWLEIEFEEDDPVLPMITDISELKLKPGQEARRISVHYRFTQGWEE